MDKIFVSVEVDRCYGGIQIDTSVFNSKKAAKDHVSKRYREVLAENKIDPKDYGRYEDNVYDVTDRGNGVFTASVSDDGDVDYFWKITEFNEDGSEYRTQSPFKEILASERRFVIDMDKKRYKDLLHDVRLKPGSDKLSGTYDVYGRICIGGLMMELTLCEYEEPEADYNLDEKRRWFLDGSLFLLGLDNGYGHTDVSQVPYSYGLGDGSCCEMTLQFDLKKSFEDALRIIVEKMNAYIDEEAAKHPEILKYVYADDLTWEKILIEGQGEF